MLKYISYQDYPSFGLHHSSRYGHGFCNSECINKFSLHYVSWSMCIAVEILSLAFLTLMLAFSLHTVLHTYLVLLMRRICLIIKIFFTGLSIPFFKTFMYNFIKCWLHLNDKLKLKFIPLRYVKVIWFLFICGSAAMVGFSCKKKKVRLESSFF